MFGSEKQIKWAEEIIHARRMEVPTELIARWEAAQEKASQIGGARFWIDTTNSARGIIAAVEAIEKMPKLTGSEKQIAYGESMRLRKLTEVATMLKGDRLPELLAEMGKETSAKAWIEGDKMEMAEAAAKNLPEEAPADEQPVEEQAAEPVEEQVAEQPAEEQVEMTGSPKQVAWAEKIIAAKAEYLRKAGVSDEDWSSARDEITRIGGARAWIDLREKNPLSILAVGKHINEFLPLIGTEKQVAYAASQRITEMAEMADVLRKYAQKDERYIEAAIQEASKITDAKTWIELSGQDIISEVEAAVKNKLDFPVQKIAEQIERLISIAPSAEDAEELMNRIAPAMEREEYAFVSAELEKAIATFREAPAEEPSVGAAPKLPSAPALAQMPPKEAAEKIITATTEEIMAAIEAAVDATLGGRWGSPSPAQQAIRSQVIADYRALLEKGGSYVADSRGRSVFTPWLRDAEKEMGAQLAEIIDKARSIDEVEEGIRALVTRTDQWAEMVARTETLSVANEANRRMYAAEGVEQVQIIAGKDERTCPICKKHHMKVYPIDKAPHLPLHPNCRCVYVPYISEGS